MSIEEKYSQPSLKVLLACHPLLRGDRQARATSWTVDLAYAKPGSCYPFCVATFWMSNGPEVTRQSRDCRLDVSLNWRALVGLLASIGPVAVLRHRGDRKKTPGMVTPAASTRKPEKNEIMTNLVTKFVIVELTNGRARSGLGLCHGKNSLQGKMNKQIPREDHYVPRTRAHWVSPVLPVGRIFSATLVVTESENLTGSGSGDLSLWWSRSSCCTGVDT